MWGLWWTKRHCGRFSPSTSVSLANHSTNFSIIITTRGWHNRPISGRSAEWTQLNSNPHYTKSTALQPLWNLAAFFQFLNLYTVCKTGDQPVARPLPIKNTQNKRTQTSMPRARFEPTIPVFKQAKAVPALDRADTVMVRPSPCAT
jgi:hypothetical protein